MSNPIGTLLLDAEARAAKKASKAHESSAPCGCTVTVSWFSTDSRTTGITRCSAHKIQRKGRP